MNNTELITVFQRASENTGDSWDRCVYKAHIQLIDSVKSENGGIINDRILKVRIPSDISLGIKPGCRVMCGECDELIFENSFFISEVCENLKGKNKHIRLLCR